MNGNTVRTYGTVTEIPVNINNGCLVAVDVTLERRIRELCGSGRGYAGHGPVAAVLSELNAMLRGHAERLKSLLAEYPFLAVKIDNPAA